VNHFVYAAVTDGYLVLFEEGHKRNFVHIRDVADCFVHAIHNAEEMAGRPFNVGADAENMSKGHLAARIAAALPHFHVTTSGTGTDPDKRNYIVSNQRLREAGFEALRTIDQGIQELVVGYAMMPRSPMRNI